MLSLPKKRLKSSIMRVLVALLAFALALSSVHADCSSATTTFTYTEGAHGPDNPIMVGDDDALCVSLGAICVPEYVFFSQSFPVIFPT